MCDCITGTMSQTRYVKGRLVKGLHPIDEVQRFRLFVSALLCSICIAMIYVFDLFTKDFRERFSLSAGDLSTVSTVGQCVCWFVLPYGFVYGHFGPTPLIALAVVVGFTGTLCLALIFTGTIPGTLASITVTYTFMCSSAGLLDSATIVTLAEVFPRNRGLIIGLAKVMTGLGSSMWASLSLSAFHNEVSSFLFFIMTLLVVVCSIALVQIRLPPYFITPWRRRRMDAAEVEALERTKPLYHTKNVPKRRLGLAFLVVFSFIVFFTVATPLKAYTTVSRGGHIALATITVAIFACFFILCLPIPWLGGVDEPAPPGDFLEQIALGQEGAAAAASRRRREAAEDQEEQQQEEGGDEGQLMPLKAKQVEEEGIVTGSPRDEDPGELRAVKSSEDDTVVAADHTAGTAVTYDSGAAATAAEPTSDTKTAVAVAMENTRQDPRYGGSLKSNLLKPDVWLLLFGFALQSAIGNMVIYNGSTISVALTGRQRTREMSALYTAFLGVGSACGRLAMGGYEAYVQHQDPQKRRFLVTMALPLPPIMAVIACILMLVIPGDAILLPYLLVYFEDGFFNAIRAIVYPCIFENNHSVYYNMSFMSSIISIVCFNRLLFGLTVDRQHDRLGFAPGADCNVAACVRVPIIVACVTAAVSAVMQGIVHWRYSRFVTGVRAERRQQHYLASNNTGEEEEEENALGATDGHKNVSNTYNISIINDGATGVDGEREGKGKGDGSVMHTAAIGNAYGHSID